MKRWTGFAIIFVAYSIALLHTAVPHHHTAGGKGKLMVSHAGCSYTHSGEGSLLQRVLSTDLGFGHLETFKKNAETRIELSTRLVTGFFLFVPLATVLRNPRSSSALFRDYIEKLHKRLLLFSVSCFRAPPLFS